MYSVNGSQDYLARSWEILNIFGKLEHDVNECAISFIVYSFDLIQSTWRLKLFLYK